MTSQDPSRRLPLDFVLGRCDGVKKMLTSGGERPSRAEPGASYGRARALMLRHGLARYAAVRTRSDLRVVAVVSEFDSKEDAVRFADDNGWADFTVVPCRKSTA